MYGPARGRLELIYLEHEELYRQSKVSVPICELRNMIEVAYLVIKMAMARRENTGLHYSLDNVSLPANVPAQPVPAAARV